MVQKLDNNDKLQNGLLQEITYIPDGDTKIQQYKQENEIKLKPDTYFLIFTIYTGLLPFIAGASNLVWISSAYPSLISNSSDINPLRTPATTGEISIIGGLSGVIGILGPMFITKLSDKIGRKLFLQISTLGMFFCILAIAFSRTAIQIIIIRCFLLTFFSSYCVIIQVYITEVCEQHTKSKYLCLMGVCMPLGYIYGYFFGPLFTYRVYTMILEIPLIPFLILFCFAPESPVYLLSRGKRKECLRELTKLRSNKSIKELENDLEIINETLKATNSSNNDKTIFQLFQTKEVRTSMIVTIILSISPPLCGMSAIVTFLGPLLIEAGTQFSENTMTVTTAFVQMISIICTSFIVEKINRKTLLIFSCIGSGIPLLLLGVFYYLKYRTDFLITPFQWLPLLLIIVLNVTFSIGLGTITPAIITEIFPSDFISAGLSFGICLNGLLSCVIVSVYPLIVENFGIHYFMWVFGVATFTIAAFIYWIVPETRGKTILEVQEILKNVKN